MRPTEGATSWFGRFFSYKENGLPIGKWPYQRPGTCDLLTVIINQFLGVRRGSILLGQATIH